MADYHSSPQTGQFAHASQGVSTPTSPLNHLTGMTNVAGAVVSLALIVGVGVWGYKLLVRDVSGIPVVKAAAGEMRIRPEEPGGQLAQHQGLSVNEVAAAGTAGAPADQLRLAPQPVDLTDEDQAVSAAMVATAPQAATPSPSETAQIEPLPVAQIVPDINDAISSGNMEDLVAQLTNGVTPLSNEVAASAPVTDSATQAVIEQLRDAEQTQVAAAVLDAPGVRQSIRPRKRPTQRAQVVQAALTNDTPAPAATAERDADSLPAGTRLAQLGAFDSEAVAREQWDQLSIRFAAYLDGKTRIVQKATSGGRVFYRLRAMGFDDIADARRFCSALVAENADCIPVVTR